MEAFSLRSTAASIGLAFLLILPLVATTGGAVISGADAPGPHTFYFHSVTPSGTLEESGKFLGAAPSPIMDETAPGPGAPKASGTETTAYFTAATSPNFAYWDAPVHADVSGFTATVHVVSPLAQPLKLDVVADDATIGTTSVPIAGGNGVYTVGIPGSGSVVSTLRFRASLVNGGAVLYDSSLTPSAFSATFAAFTGTLGGGGGGNNTTTSLPRTPAAGWGPVTLANRTLANREASLALDPTNINRVAMCTPTGVPQTSYGHSLFVLSNDGGASWNAMDVEQKTTDTRKYTFEGGDCDIAFDDGGTMYTADTWLGDLSVGHSTDHGVTWDGTAIAGTAPVVDRPWLVGGPAGTLHVTWQDVQFGMPTAIWYTRTTDFGNTFLPAVPVTDSQVTGAFSWEGNLVVAPGGQDMYLVYTTRVDPQYLTGKGEGVWVAASHNAGLTWTQHKVTLSRTSASYLYPSIGLDTAGGLHVVYAANATTDQPVWYSYSGDGAASWSAPIKVASNVGAFAPWVVGAGPGQAAIIWYGVKNDFPSTARDQDWFLFAYRVSGANTGTPVFTGGATTTTPVFSGTQTMPEFDQVRLDSAGKIHIGASIFVKNGSSVSWGLFHQMET